MRQIFGFFTSFLKLFSAMTFGRFQSACFGKFIEGLWPAKHANYSYGMWDKASTIFKVVFFRRLAINSRKVSTLNVTIMLIVKT